MKRRWEPQVIVLIGLITLSAVVAESGGGPVPPSGGAPALELATDAKELALTKGLAVGLIGAYGRSTIPADLLAWQLAQGTMAEPAAGVVVGKNSKGEDQAWIPVGANKDGWIENRALSGGYLFVVVDADKARTMILDATGFYVAWINGECRGGEKYGADYLRHPVRLVQGRNTLLFRGERGRFKGRLYAPPADIFFTDKDMTLPDLVIGETGPVWAGLRLVNATGERLERLEILWRAGAKEGRGAGGGIRRPVLHPEAGRSACGRCPGGRGAGQDRDPGQGRSGPAHRRDPAVRDRAQGGGGDGASFADLRQRDRRQRPVFRRGADGGGRNRADRGRGGPETRARSHAPRRERRGHRAGPGVQTQGLGLDRRGHEPAPLRIRLGGLGAARRARGPGRSDAALRAGSGPSLPHRPFHGRPRDLAGRGDRAGALGGHRPERGLAELHLVRRGSPIQGSVAGREDAPAGERSERDDGAGPQPPPLSASMSCTATRTTTCPSPRPGPCAGSWASSTRTSPTMSGRAPATGGGTSASTGRRSCSS